MHKSKILGFESMQDVKKWFKKWASHLLHDAASDSSINEGFFQCQCITAWERCGSLSFTQYIVDIEPNYKTMSFFKTGNGNG